MTYALDDAFYRGGGRRRRQGHRARRRRASTSRPATTSARPGATSTQSFPRTATLWWDHVGKPGAESRFARESEVYLGMCRRWREMPKPTIAMVQGACIAGGLMLAWCCDLIVAADDAFFADPVVRMGIPGVEYFAHPWVMGPRFAKEFLFLGERVRRARALELGMVNRVVPAGRAGGVHDGRSPAGSRRCRGSGWRWPRRRSTRPRT